MEVEESTAALKAADAVVQACLVSGGKAGEGGEAAAPPPAGPFRPATDAEPAEAERLFMENYRWVQAVRSVQQWAGVTGVCVVCKTRGLL